MRVKTFSYSAVFSKIDVSRFTIDFDAWVKSNAGIEIKEIKHDISSGAFWYPPQLVVSVYYVEKA